MPAGVRKTAGQGACPQGFGAEGSRPETPAQDPRRLSPSVQQGGRTQEHLRCGQPAATSDRRGFPSPAGRRSLLACGAASCSRRRSCQAASHRSMRARSAVMSARSS